MQLYTNMVRRMAHFHMTMTSHEKIDLDSISKSSYTSIYRHATSTAPPLSRPQPTKCTTHS